jgi:glycosyltransferase involved in cell wall biosynthesis
MILAGNSNITSFRQQGLQAASHEQTSVHWVGALQINHFFDDHPAGAKVRRLFAAEQGWKFLSIGTHDVFALCHFSSQNKQKESLATLRELYRQVFTEFQQDGRLAWLIFPQPLHQVSFPGLTSKDILAIANLFYDTIKSLCLEHNIPVIDPCASIVDRNGEPLSHLVQRDGIHLNVEGIKIYLDRISALTGLTMKLINREAPFEPASEVESFCSLLLDELGVPFHAVLSPSDFQKELSQFISGLLRDRGLDMTIDNETELVDSGLLDSLSLVQVYTYATDLIKLEIPFDVSLRALNTLSKISDFLFGKKNVHGGPNAENLSQQDFLLSLGGDYADADQKDRILEADRHIGSMDDTLFRSFQEEVAIASHGVSIRYGIILFWVALNKASRGDYRRALEYIEAAGDRRRAFPFQSPRVDFYSTDWRAKSPDTSGKKKMLWELQVDESVLRVTSPIEDALKNEYQKVLALAEKGDVNEAVLSLERLAQNNPGIALFANDLGVLYTRLGNKEKSLAAYQKAVKIDPSNITFLKNLADFQYAQQGDIAGAFALYSKALSIKPDDVETLSLLGHICIVNLNRVDDGKFFFSRVIALDPDNAVAQGTLAALNAKRSRQLSQQPESGTDKDDGEVMIRPDDGAKDYLVTALVSAYNSERFIRGCLEDLEAQTIADKVEIIVIDSCSPQNESAIVEEFQKRYSNIKYIRTEQRETVYQAWNRGIQAAKGKYITNANTDDRHRKDAFAMMVKVLEEHHEIALVYANVIVTNAENETFEKHTPSGVYNWYDWDRSILLGKGCFMGPQPMWRRSVHDLYGFFDESMVTSGDYEFWLRISQTLKFHHIKEFLGLYLASPTSVEHINREIAQKENNRIFTLYRSAARKKILHFRPFEQLAELAKKDPTSRNELIRLVDIIDDCAHTVSVRQNESLSWTHEDAQRLDTQMRENHFLEAYHLLAKAILTGLHKKYIPLFIRIASKHLLERDLNLSDPKTDEGTNTVDAPTVSRQDKLPRSITKGLTSIIIVPSEPHQRVSHCIEGISRNTPEPHEIIVVVDSATGKILQKTNKGLGNFSVLEVANNNGRPALFNKGINASSGEYLLLLDDGMDVTGEWLSGMLKCLHSSPDAGIIGPLTHGIDGLQQVKIGEIPRNGDRDRFSRDFRRRNMHRRILAKNIYPSCLLFRRALFEQLGSLDEAFETINLSIDDYCMRSLLLGHSNMICGDVLLYYAGNKTGADTRRRGSPNALMNKWSGFDVQSLLGKQLALVNTLASAREFYDRGQADLAFQALLNAIKAVPTDRSVYHVFAELLIDSKQFKHALDILDAMPDRASDFKAFVLAGYCKEGMELLDEAFADAEHTLTSGQFTAMALNLKGLVADKRSDRIAAENYFQKAIEADPGFGEPYTMLGVLRWSSGQRDEAIDLLERGFILSPFQSYNVTRYFSAVTEMEVFPRAEKIFTEAKALYPSNRRIAFLLIDILLKQEKHDPAMDEIEQAMIVFGIDDGILNAAIAVRQKIGPLQKSKTSPSQKTLSLCMIVKNEQKHLARCLQSVKPVVDEMIVVDTGSSDRTKDIATAFGAKVFDSPWTGDFSVARNYSLAQATGDWVLILDADEVIARQDHEELRKLITSKSSLPMAYDFVTRNYIVPVHVTGWKANDGKYPEEEAGTGWAHSLKVRLFPRDARIKFVNPVHELVETSIRQINMRIKNSAIPIHHYGKLDQCKDMSKGQEYYKLGRKKLEETGDNVDALRELAIQAGQLDRCEEAVDLWNRLLKIEPNMLYAYINLVHVNLQMDKFEDALSAAKKALALGPDIREVISGYALCEMYAGDVEQTVLALEDLSKRDPGYPFATVMLLAAYFCSGRTDKGAAIIESQRLSGSSAFAEAIAPFISKLMAAGRITQAKALLDGLAEKKIEHDQLTALSVECV